MEELKATLSLSKITLGTMRFFDKSLSTKQVTNLIEDAFSTGINTHHSSAEYSSYVLYNEALKQASCANKVKHIVKLSAPHFEDDTFSSKLLEQRVDKELRALNIETIDVLQWLLRSKPINDKNRLNTLLEYKDEIESVLQKLKQKGKVKSVFSFPYSVPFANAVEQLNEVDGIISYLNKEEQEYLKFATEKPFIAIRPFFAGKLLKDSENIKKSIKNCLDHINTSKTVITTIVGINSVQQLEDFKN